MKPRVKRIIKRVGETCTIIALYAPVIIFIYSYVLYDCMRDNPDSSLTK
jgi:hypothetical protein